MTLSDLLWLGARVYPIAIDSSDRYAAPGGGLGVVGKPDADLVIKALDMAYEQRGRPSGLLFHSDQGGAIRKPAISSAIVALSHAPEHESPGKLLG